MPDSPPPLRRVWVRVRRAYTLQPGQKHLGFWPHAWLVVAIAVWAVFMVTAGNRLLGLSLVRLTGPDRDVQFAVGFAWLFTAIGLGWQADQARRKAVRRGMTLACTLMLVLAFLVVPIGRGNRATGAGEYAPSLELGLIVSLPVSLLTWWLLRIPVRRRKEARA